MLYLEVTVNGQPYCVAGDEPFVAAGVAGSVDFEGRSLRGMKVAALGGGRTGFERWGADAGFLKLGDVITVRIVERAAANPPRWSSQTPPVLFQAVSRGVEAELWLWVWLIVGTAAILLFG